jgi:hypothetical protein
MDKTILDLLIGKKMKVMTDMKVEVELEIASIKEDFHSVDLEPATRANDWWPASRDWTTYLVKFTNGSAKSFSNISEIKIIS